MPVGENKTNVARVKAMDITGEKLTEVTGFILKEKFDEKVEMKPLQNKEKEPDTVKMPAALVAVWEEVTKINDKNPFLQKF